MILCLALPRVCAKARALSVNDENGNAHIVTTQREMMNLLFQLIYYGFRNMTMLSALQKN